MQQTLTPSRPPQTRGYCKLLSAWPQHLHSLSSCLPWSGAQVEYLTIRMLCTTPKQSSARLFGIALCTSVGDACLVWLVTPPSHCHAVRCQRKQIVILKLHTSCLEAAVGTLAMLKRGTCGARAKLHTLRSCLHVTAAY